MPGGRKTDRERRIEAEAKALPPISPHLIDAVLDLLMSEGSRVDKTAPPPTKPPEKTAAMLVLIDELHQRGYPFPTRAAAAKALDCNIFTIDAALSKQTAEERVEFEIKTREGHVAVRPSVVKDRYYAPSKDLQDLLRRTRKKFHIPQPRKEQ